MNGDIKTCGRIIWMCVQILDDLVVSLIEARGFYGLASSVPFL